MAVLQLTFRNMSLGKCPKIDPATGVRKSNKTSNASCCARPRWSGGNDLYHSCTNFDGASRGGYPLNIFTRFIGAGGFRTVFLLDLINAKVNTKTCKNACTRKKEHVCIQPIIILQIIMIPTFNIKIQFDHFNTKFHILDTLPTYKYIHFNQHSHVRGPLWECRSIRSGASRLPYYCAPLVCVSDVMELLAV